MLAILQQFRLSNAPLIFQRFINNIFTDLLDVCVIVYLDDILIYSENLQDHKQQVKEVLHCLKTNGLYTAPNKCLFHQEEVEFLGYIFSTNGLQMDEEKVQTICDWPTPRRVKDVQFFLGFVNFYRLYTQLFQDHHTNDMTHQKNNTMVLGGGMRLSVCHTQRIVHHGPHSDMLGSRCPYNSGN